MIISKIVGGLGNQMFQYAVGRSLSSRHSVPLRLDISAFAGYELHQGFELQRVFNCQTHVAAQSDMRRVLGWQSSAAARRLVARSEFSAIRQTGFVVEPHFNFWPGLFDVASDSYLVGYWQSEKYFQSYASLISNDFTFAVPLKDKNEEAAQEIAQVDAVSLHVRRGDYISNSKTNATHGVCSLEYYMAAIRYISQKVENPYYFVFSDDIAWARENLKIQTPCQYVGHNLGASSFNDMHLMSLCKHHIIANSSFSWWGAWLNPRLSKLVVAPKKWFNNGANTGDLIPVGWMSL